MNKLQKIVEGSPEIIQHKQKLQELDARLDRLLAEGLAAEQKRIVRALCCCLPKGLDDATFRILGN